MSLDILMPALSPTMEEGTLAKWLVAEGDSVVSGDVIAEIETDKATMEVEAVDEGVIAKLIVAAGTEGVKVNAVIAVLAEEGEDPASVQPGKSGTPAPAPAPAEAVPEVVSKLDTPAATSATVHGSAGSGANGDRVLASPLARRLASQNGLYLAGLVFKWVKANGGLAGMAAQNQAKADLLYNAIDASNFYSAPVAPADRSVMNVPFTLADAALDADFLAQAEARGMFNLKGHRSVGGMRASIYNAVSMESVQTLVTFMSEFENERG